MCFLPNSRASTDIAKLAPRVASTRGTSGSPTRDKTTDSSTMVTSSPPAGVDPHLNLSSHATLYGLK
jgi:hypothetical protein